MLVGSGTVGLPATANAVGVPPPFVITALSSNVYMAPPLSSSVPLMSFSERLSK